MAEVTLELSVEYDESQTNPEDLAVALDTLLCSAMSTPGVLADCGDVHIGCFTYPEDSAVRWWC